MVHAVELGMKRAWVTAKASRHLGHVARWRALDCTLHQEKSAGNVSQHRLQLDELLSAYGNLQSPLLSALFRMDSASRAICRSIGPSGSTPSERSTSAISLTASAASDGVDTGDTAVTGR